MKNILLHVKDNEQISKYRQYEKKGYEQEEHYSREIRFMINEFKINNWNVYLTSLDNFDYQKKIWKNVYNLTKDKYENISIEKANTFISTIIVRVIGSVEGNFTNIKNYLQILSNDYKGLVLNNPQAMLKGMTKNYLCEIDKKKLNEIGIQTIDTQIFSNKISYEEIKGIFTNKEKYLIKPLSGELSNSLANLSKIDEDFLRRKQDKVMGWVVQPIMDEIYQGEYQMSFLNSELIYSQKKEYTTKNNGIPNQKERILKKYHPTEKEIDIMKKVIDYFKKLYKIEINICRIDFMKNKDNKPILLEFEMVNPGFFIGYMKENDNDILTITSKIREYCEQNNRLE